MFKIEIYDSQENKSWEEEYDSYYLFRKRVIKIKHSDRLKIIFMSNLSC